MEKYCVMCFTSFIAKRDSGIYCSNACKMKAYRQLKVEKEIAYFQQQELIEAENEKKRELEGLDLLFRQNEQRFQLQIEQWRLEEEQKKQAREEQKRAEDLERLAQQKRDEESERHADEKEKELGRISKKGSIPQNNTDILLMSGVFLVLKAAEYYIPKIFPPKKNPIQDQSSEDATLQPDTP